MAEQDDLFLGVVKLTFSRALFLRTGGKKEDDTMMTASDSLMDKTVHLSSARVSTTP